ncbi:MAG: TraG/TraD/VirD4 family protein, partial [Pseudomonadota bacterium]
NALQQTARLQALKRNREGRPVFFLADEGTNLPIPTVIQEIELMRSAKISIALLYQSVSSLIRTYGKEQSESIRSNCAEMYFAVSDFATADEISKRAGDKTIKTRSVGFSGRQSELPSENIGEAGRRLLPPEDILAMDPSEAILLMPGLRPVKVSKLPWFEVEPFKSLAGDNPHERFPKSPVTRLRLDYGRNANELRPPRLPDIEHRRARAMAMEASATKPRRVPLVRARSFLWMPIVAVFAALIASLGTPHVLFEYDRRANHRGEWRCVYFGFGGFKQTRLRTSCPLFHMLRHWEDAP